MEPEIIPSPEHNFKHSKQKENTPQKGEQKLYYNTNVVQSQSTHELLPTRKITPLLKLQEIPQYHLNLTSAGLQSPRNHDYLISWKTALIRQKSCDQLLHLFQQQPLKLAHSDALNSSFQLKSCFSRLRTGYKVLILNYLNNQLRQVHFKMTTNCISLQSQFRIIKLGVKQVLGIIVQPLSSNFQMLQKEITLNQLEIDQGNCLTIITKTHSIDIVTKSHKAKYDIYLALSWLVSSYSQKSASIPLSKSLLTRNIVVNKIRRYATERCLFFSQIWILAILKYMKQINEDQGKIQKIKNIFNKKFHGQWRLYRLCKLMKPKFFAVNKALIQQQKQMFRTKQLSCRRIELLLHSNGSHDDKQHPQVLQIFGMHKLRTIIRRNQRKFVLNKEIERAEIKQRLLITNYDKSSKTLN